MDHMGGDSWQALVAVLWPYAQELLKNSNSPLFSWIRSDTTNLNSFLSALVAVLTTAGFHFMGDWNGGTLTIPPIVSLGHVAAQWLAQHIIYKISIEGPATQKQILAELQKANGGK